MPQYPVSEPSREFAPDYCRHRKIIKVRGVSTCKHCKLENPTPR